MYYHHWFIYWFEKNCIYRQSCRLPDSASRGIIFRLRISRRIRNEHRNGSKCSVRDSWGTDLCKNPRKSASLPCPFKSGSCSWAEMIHSDLAMSDQDLKYSFPIKPFLTRKSCIIQCIILFLLQSDPISSFITLAYIFFKKSYKKNA